MQSIGALPSVSLEFMNLYVILNPVAVLPGVPGKPTGLTSIYPSSIFHPDKMKAIIRAVLPFFAVFFLAGY